MRFEAKIMDIKLLTLLTWLRYSIKGNHMKLPRLHGAILFLLQRAKIFGINDLSKFQIMKLIYLADVESRKFVGEPLTSDLRFVRDQHGPISYNIYSAITDLTGKYIKVKPKKKPDYPFARECHSLIKGKKLPKIFTKEEKLFLNSVFGDYLSLTQKQLKVTVYKTEPMSAILKQEKKGKVLKGRPIDMNLVPLDEDLLEMITDVE